jgi:hypothetical protein
VVRAREDPQVAREVGEELDVEIFLFEPLHEEAARCPRGRDSGARPEGGATHETARAVGSDNHVEAFPGSIGSEPRTVTFDLNAPNALPAVHRPGAAGALQQRPVQHTPRDHEDRLAKPDAKNGSCRRAEAHGADGVPQRL